MLHIAGGHRGKEYRMRIGFFGYPKEKTNMPNGTNDVASILLAILAYDKMYDKSFLKSQVGVISLGAFQVFC